jgi:hypothetical protein
LRPQFIAIGRLQNFNVIQLDVRGDSTADSFIDDEIDCRNVRDSGSRLRPLAATAAEDNMMILVVVVVVTVVDRFEFWRCKRAEF